MGFLSGFEHVTIRFNDRFQVDEAGKWWVRVQTSLERKAFRRAQAKLMTPVMVAKGKDVSTTANVSSAEYVDELVFAAVLDWNFTDREDKPLPLAPDAAKRESIDALPEEVVEAIHKAVRDGTPGADTSEDGLKGDEAERERFPEGGQGRPDVPVAGEGPRGGADPGGDPGGPADVA